ncbi:MAG: short-chain dehydrogenase [Candidatus Dojkabacteria bacterium]|nr:MAG: short-chain dehydrogenase [Candidatus Dojkabacteria bacterium]
MENIFDLTGKKAIVTGASSGLGVQFAKALARYGADVAILARRKERLEKLAEEIQSMGRKCIPIQCDVTVESQIQQAVKQVEQEFGKIDILVNNAGVVSAYPTEDLPLDEWNRIIQTNLTGVFLMAKHVAQVMKKHGTGSIINISSIAGFVSFEGISVAAYGASKGGVVNLTRYLASEWGKYGIRVNSIAPGFFPSEMTQAFVDDPNMLAYIKSRTALDRWGKDGELDGLLIYLASDASSYTTGQNIAVDGGWLAE